MSACVLAFHRVVERVERDHDLDRSAFLRLLDELTEARVRFSSQLPVPTEAPASVVLTFDDGTADHRRVAEELGSRAIPAVFFVSAGLLGADGYLRSPELSEIVSLGHVIGSHGMNHRRLDRLLDPQVEAETRLSKELLERQIEMPVTLYAPAGGIGVTDLRLRLESAGYTASRSMRWGIHLGPEERWSVPIVPVTQVTVDRGWVQQAARQRRLPRALAALRFAKDVLPDGARSRVRRVLSRALSSPR